MDAGSRTSKSGWLPAGNPDELSKLSAVVPGGTTITNNREGKSKAQMCTFKAADAGNGAPTKLVQKKDIDGKQDRNSTSVITDGQKDASIKAAPKEELCRPKDQTHAQKSGAIKDSDIHVDKTKNHLVEHLEGEDTMEGGNYHDGVQNQGEEGKDTRCESKYMDRSSSLGKMSKEEKGKADGLESVEEMSATVINMSRNGQKDEAMEYAVAYTGRAHELYGSAHSSYINGLATVAALCNAKGSTRSAHEILTRAEMLQEDVEVTAVEEALIDEIKTQKGNAAEESECILQSFAADTMRASRKASSAEFEKLTKLDEKKLKDLLDTIEVEDKNGTDDADGARDAKTSALIEFLEEERAKMGEDDDDDDDDFEEYSDDESDEDDEERSWGEESEDESVGGGEDYDETVESENEETASSRGIDDDHVTFEFDEDEEDEEDDGQEIGETDIITALADDVNTLLQEQKHEEAAALLTHSENELHKALGPLSPVSIASFHTLWAALMEAMGEGEKAQALYDEAKLILEDVKCDEAGAGAEGENNEEENHENEDEDENEDVRCESMNKRVMSEIDEAIHTLSTSAERSSKIRSPEGNAHTYDETSLDSKEPTEPPHTSELVNFNDNQKPHDFMTKNRGISCSLDASMMDTPATVAVPSKPSIPHPSVSRRMGATGRRFVHKTTSSSKETTNGDIIQQEKEGEGDEVGEQSEHELGNNSNAMENDDEHFDQGEERESDCGENHGKNGPVITSPSKEKGSKEKNHTRAHGSGSPTKQRLSPLEARTKASITASTPAQSPTRRRCGGGFIAPIEVCSPKRQSKPPSVKHEEVAMREDTPPMELPYEEDKIDEEKVHHPEPQEIVETSEEKVHPSKTERIPEMPHEEVMALAQELSERDEIIYGPLTPAVSHADTCISRNKLSEAADVLEALLEAIGSTDTNFRNSNIHVSVFEKFGNVLRMQGDFSGALDALTAADEILEERPGNGEATGRAGLHQGMGEICMEMGSYTSAQKLFEKALMFFQALRRNNDDSSALTSSTRSNDDGSSPTQTEYTDSGSNGSTSKREKNENEQWTPLARAECQRCLGGLAHAYMKQGRIQEAEGVYLIAYELEDQEGKEEWTTLGTIFRDREDIGNMFKELKRIRDEQSMLKC